MSRTSRAGPRKPSKTADANLDCEFVENALFFKLILDIEKSTGRTDLVVTIPEVSLRREVHLTDIAAVTEVSVW